MSINKYYILVAEGITDCSFLEAVLENYLGFIQYSNMKELPALFTEMIGKYPAATGELQKQDSPTFFYKDHIGIAVKQAGGCSKIPTKVSLLAEIIDNLEIYEDFGGFLVFCDSDLAAKEKIKKDFSKRFKEYGIEFKDDYFLIYENKISCKLYIFPALGEGAIEKILLECVKVSYNNLYCDSHEFRDLIMSECYQEFRKKYWAKEKETQEFYSDKVQFGAVSAALKPDKPVRFTIKDRLIKPEYLDLYMELPEFKALHNFLQSNLV